MIVCEHYDMCGMSEQYGGCDEECPCYAPKIDRSGLMALADAMCAAKVYSINDAWELIEDSASQIYKALDGEDMQAWQNARLVEIIYRMENDARVLGDDYGVAADVLRTRAAQLREAFGIHG